MAIDQYGRDIDYLRISLTDQCNLRCVYCMPDDMTFQASENLLTDGEIIRVAGLFADLGFHKIRITGGEPTLRPNLPALVHALKNQAGIREVAMTTNALLLKHLARPLVDAGLDRVNVSIDTLDPGRFRQITRWGNIQDVWTGITAAETAGLPVKINAVLIKGWNDGEDAVALARLTRVHRWQVRFIEMMPLGSISDFQTDHVVVEQSVMDRIATELGSLNPVNGGALDGEARVYQLADGMGTIGFISSVSNPFCASCNRVRLTAEGTLRLCLLRDDELPLRALLRNGTSDKVLKQRIAASIWTKPWGHGLASQEIARSRVMSEIGG